MDDIDSDDLIVRVGGEEDSSEEVEASLRRIEALNRQADADRARVAQARAETAYYRDQAARRSVESAMLTADSEIGAAKSAYGQAFDMGDPSAAMEAVDRLTDAKVNRALLQNYARAPAAPPQTTDDPVEDFANTLTPRSADWVRRHGDYVTDPRKNARLTSAHWNAVSEGLQADTDEYFAHVEKTLGMRGNNRSRSNRDVGPLESSEMSGRDHVVVQRGSGESLPAGTVKMSRNAYEMATEVIKWNYNDPNGKFRRGDPIGVREYLRRQNQMRRDGRLDDPFRSGRGRSIIGNIIMGAKRDQIMRAIKTLEDRNKQITKDLEHTKRMREHDPPRYALQQQALEREWGHNVAAIRQMRWEIPLDEMTYVERQGQF